MSQTPETSIDCFQQSFSHCIGLFKKSSSSAQTQLCDSNSKFAPLSVQPGKMPSKKSSVLCMCCRGSSEQSNDSESTPIKKVVTTQPQKNFDTFEAEKNVLNGQLTQNKLTTKEADEVQNIVGDTNPEKLNMDYSSYLTNNKDDSIFKTKDGCDEQMERNFILNTKNNNRNSTSTSDINVSLKAEPCNNKNNSCLNKSHDDDVTSIKTPYIENNNKFSEIKSNDPEPVDRPSQATPSKENCSSQDTMEDEYNVTSKLNGNSSGGFMVEEQSINGISNGIEIEGKQEHSTTHFRKLTLTNTDDLNALCSTWDKILLQESSDIPEEVQNEIRSVIGQTRLVISERFKQFLSLVDRADGLASVKGNEENLKPINNSDLQGFWDMIYFQVEDVHIKFKRLYAAKDKQWTLEEPKPDHKPKTVAKKKPVARRVNKNPKIVSEAEKVRREAARKRVLEARKNMALRKKQVINTSEENGDVLIL